MFGLQFPRVGLPLHTEFLELTKQCKTDIDILKRDRTMQRVEWFLNRYGSIFISEVQLGGRLYSTQHSSSFGNASAEQKSEMLKYAASASISGWGAHLSASFSHDEQSGSKSTASASNLSRSLIWHADGGDTLLCNKLVRHYPLFLLC